MVKQNVAPVSYRIHFDTDVALAPCPGLIVGAGVADAAFSCVFAVTSRDDLVRGEALLGALEDVDVVSVGLFWGDKLRTHLECDDGSGFWFEKADAFRAIEERSCTF